MAMSVKLGPQLQFSGDTAGAPNRRATAQWFFFHALRWLALGRNETTGTRNDRHIEQEGHSGRKIAYPNRRQPAFNRSM